MEREPSINWFEPGTPIHLLVRSFGVGHARNVSFGFYLWSVERDGDTAQFVVDVGFSAFAGTDFDLTITESATKRSSRICSSAERAHEYVVLNDDLGLGACTPVSLPAYLRRAEAALGIRWDYRGWELRTVAEGRKRVALERWLRSDDDGTRLQPRKRTRARAKPRSAGEPGSDER